MQVAAASGSKVSPSGILDAENSSYVDCHTKGAGIVCHLMLDGLLACLLGLVSSKACLREIMRTGANVARTVMVL